MSEALPQEFYDNFHEEAQESLARWEQACLNLESRAENAPELLNVLYRQAHNLKGSSRSIGLENFGAFIHTVEDLISDVINNKVGLESEIIGAILESQSCLVEWNDALLKNRDFIPLRRDALVTRILSLREVKEEAALANVMSSTKASDGVFWADIPSDPVPTSGATASNIPTVSNKHNAALKFDTPHLDSKTDASVVTNLVKNPAAVPQEEKLQAAIKNQNANSPEEQVLRVSLKKLDGLINIVGELVVNQSVMASHRDNKTSQSDHALQTISYMSKLVAELQDTAMSLRLVPVKPLFQKMNRTLRDIGQILGKDIQFETLGEEVEIDKSVLEKIGDPLTHIIRNAADHGIESPTERAALGKNRFAKVVLSAENREDRIVISVSDDGKGMNRDVILQKGIQKGLVLPHAQLSDAEIYNLIFKPGFSTKESVTEISGRGVGMDVVMQAINELKGDVSIQTKLHEGSKIEISLPLSLSIVDVMVISAGDRRFLIPKTQLVEIVEFKKLNIETVTGKGRIVSLRGEVIPVYILEALFGKRFTNAEMEARNLRRTRPGVVFSYLGRKMIVEIDDILWQQQVVLKKLGHEMQNIPGVIAGAVMSNGEPGLVLSLQDLVVQRSTHVA